MRCHTHIHSSTITHHTSVAHVYHKKKQKHSLQKLLKEVKELRLKVKLSVSEEKTQRLCKSPFTCKIVGLHVIHVIHVFVLSI